MLKSFRAPQSTALSLSLSDSLLCLFRPNNSVIIFPLLLTPILGILLPPPFTEKLVTSRISLSPPLLSDFMTFRIIPVPLSTPIFLMFGWLLDNTPCHNNWYITNPLFVYSYTISHIHP